MFERHLTGTYIEFFANNLWVADAGRARLSRHLRQLGGRLQSCGRLLRSRQDACAGDVDEDVVANVDVDVDVILTSQV